MAKFIDKNEIMIIIIKNNFKKTLLKARVMVSYVYKIFYHLSSGSVTLRQRRSVADETS